MASHSILFVRLFAGLLFRGMRLLRQCHIIETLLSMANEDEGEEEEEEDRARTNIIQKNPQIQ